MAVAVHVGRVAKDYAPHGYSINESVASTIILPTGTTATYYIPVIYADDCDVYVEGAGIFGTVGIPSHAANYWSFTLVSAPVGVASETPIASNTVGGASTVITVKTLTEFVINKPVVSKGQQILVKAVSNHNSAPAATLSVVCRFRRQA
jgi:hypothetical protein